MKAIELLAPAGSPEALDAAMGEGADAVYLGLRGFNARLRSVNFAYSQFEAACQAVHGLGKKIYVTVNTLYEERESDRIFQMLEYLQAVGPDAIIVQDLGVARMAKRHLPGLRLHASTQMNVSSAAGAHALSRLGFSRVVLGRELGLGELAGLSASTNMELEVFVHGALCVSVSGLCLFSSYLGGKSANRGCCAQACRRLYRGGGEQGYFFSPADLELAGFVPQLAAAGVGSLKIEGRMKSAEYVGAVVSAYRGLLDGAGDPQALARAKAILKNDFARAKTSYYLGSEIPDFLRSQQAGGTGIALGKVREIASIDGARHALCGASGTGLEEGDSLRVHGAADGARRTVKLRSVIRRDEKIWLGFEGDLAVGDEIYLIQTKAMTRRYKPVLPKDLSPFKRMPGWSKAPRVEPSGGADRSKDSFPEGLYAVTEKVADLYVFQSSPPERAVLRLGRANLAQVLGTANLPFRGEGLIPCLDPYFPESEAPAVEEAIDRLAAAGSRAFIANNLGHITLIKKRGLKAIAGEYLYALNSQAKAQLRELGCDFSIAPLEISKQNLLAVAEESGPWSIAITLFAYPALFRLRADLGTYYDFTDVQAREGEDFQLMRGEGGSVVIPNQAFSITDRAEFLRSRGFRRFFLDFSYAGLKKPEYKRVFQAARESQALNGTSRFNWKEGFWNPDEKGPEHKTEGKSEARAAKPGDGLGRNGGKGRPGLGPRNGSPRRKA